MAKAANKANAATTKQATAPAGKRAAVEGFALSAEQSKALDEATAAGNIGEARVIVRGRLEKGGPIVRRMRTIRAIGSNNAECTEYALAVAHSGLFADIARAAKLVEVTTEQVSYECGVKQNGQVSKGFGTLPNGATAWVSRNHKAGEPVPTHMLEKFGFAPNGKPVKASQPAQAT